MRHIRWIGVALSIGLLTGCPGGLGLNPETLDQINSMLGEYGLNLKTVDPSTGEARTYQAADVSQVVGEDGKPIDYKFDGDKMVFRPGKEGQQRITVKLKDGTTQQFTIEGKQSDARMTGDVAFIPDGSGQGFTTEVGIGQAINVRERHGAIMDQMASKRIKLTFGSENLAGLSPDMIKAVYFDRMKLPPFTYAVVDGVLKVDPMHFFMAREYQKHSGSYPMVRVGYMKDGKLMVVLAAMADLPQLPDFTLPQPGQAPPPPPGPDAFASDQTLDLEIKMSESLDMTIEAYETEKQLQTNVPRPGEAPPPPSDTEQAAIREHINEFGVTFNVSTLAGVGATDVKAMFVGKMERPMMDLLSIGTGGEVKLDPMMIGHAFQLWYGPLSSNTTNAPWIRIYFQDGSGGHVAKFRFKANTVPTWFSGPIGWDPPVRSDAIGWFPPQPPFGVFGTGNTVSGTDMEIGALETAVSLDTFRTNLRNKTGPNPD